MAVIWILIPTDLAPDDSQFEGFKYACYIRYLEPFGSDPHPKMMYNTLDSEWKGFAVLLCNYLHEKNDEQDFLFWKPQQVRRGHKVVMVITGQFISGSG